jgi:hypothetical protein
MWRAINRLLLALARVVVAVFWGGAAIACVIAAAALVPNILAAVRAEFPSLAGCADQMSACYRAWKMPDAMKRTRLAAMSNFAASEKAIAFQLILDNDEYGLLFIDRATGQSKLIYEKDKAYVRPHFEVSLRQIPRAKNPAR